MRKGTENQFENYLQDHRKTLEYEIKLRLV